MLTHGGSPVLRMGNRDRQGADRREKLAFETGTAIREIPALTGRDYNLWRQPEPMDYLNSSLIGL